MVVSINNAGGYYIPKNKIVRLFKIIDKVFSNIKKAEISIAFVDNPTIKKLNRKYRGKNKVTDVLSFPEFKNIKSYRVGAYLGEIIISYPVAKKQSQQLSHTVIFEIIFLLIHGYLHLIGYDHLNKKDEQLMTAQEKTILDLFYKYK